MPDSSSKIRSKSGSPTQPSSRPPFRRDWLGIRFSSWIAVFQLEKRIPKTTFITAPFQEGLAGDHSCSKKRILKTTFITAVLFQEGLAGDPLFELESGGIGWGSAFRAGMPDLLEKRIPKTTFITAPFQRDWLGIRFSSWNAGFQLEKRTKTTFITAPFQEGLAGDPLFELDCRSSSKGLGVRFSSWKSGAPRQPSSRPPFRRDWLRIRFSSRIPVRKADPQDNLHHGHLSGGIGWGSAFRAGMPDSSSKSGSPRQPSSRPPFRRDWLGIRFSSWNAGFQLEKRIPKTTFITAPFQEGLAGDPLFELECRIPVRKAEPQDNLHHGPLSGGIG